MNTSIKELSKYRFLFEELVKRDFKKKYKRTLLGMGWSMLLPTLVMLVMRLVFGRFFGGSIEHYTIYIFCGNIIFCWFSEATNLGMRSLYANAPIFTKVNVPKYLFLFSGSVQTFINFIFTLLVFFAFCAFDGIDFSWRMLALAYPAVTMLVFNAGMGLVLSALFLFFRDIDYLWGVFLQLLMYGSAIFYSTSKFTGNMRLIFDLNPVYRHIEYFREVVISGKIPAFTDHLALLAFAFAALAAGFAIYRRYNTRFLYYV